ncbi:MAG: hypothetical protein KatS3mg076_0210 [Candidatus Binatia bacterium]|nr:MAG: hypothetical protein KatS3mg076_0210 [Candidatus Binatia bacterium]
MEFGLGTPVVQQVPSRARAWEGAAGSRELLRIAERADRFGYAWVTCSDHVAVPASHVPAMGATWYEPIATLGFFAARTRRVRLLSHVMVLAYRHPLVLAKAFATLDRLSGGRVILGVGTGHAKAEFSSLGVSYERRGALADEALAALACALENETSSFGGEFFRWRDMVVDPRPLQRPRPPIWVGGNGRRAVLRAARGADGWIPWQVSLEEFRELARLGREERSRAGLGGWTAVAPLAVGAGEAEGEVLERIEAWKAAGADAFHVGLPHTSFEEFLDRMEWFAEVARRAGLGFVSGRSGRGSARRAGAGSRRTSRGR